MEGIFTPKQIETPQYKEKEIFDIRGKDLEFFQQLQKVTKSLDIKEIDASNNVITSLDLKFMSNFPNLEVFRITDNQITKIQGFADKKKLKFLDISQNHVALIDDLEPNKQLVQIIAYANKIHSVFLRSVLPNLVYLDLRANMLNQLNFGMKMPALKTLLVSNCQILELPDFETFPELTYLDLARNKIAEITGIYKNKLKTLILSRNQITTLKYFRKFKNLVELDISYNEIDDIGFGEAVLLKELRVLNASATRIKSFSLVNKICPQLEYLDLSYSKVEKLETLLEYIKDNQQLRVLDLRGTEITAHLYVLQPREIVYESIIEYDSFHPETAEKRARYRREVIKNAPSLQILDGIQVTEADRSEITSEIKEEIGNEISSIEPKNNGDDNTIIPPALQEVHEVQEIEIKPEEIKFSDKEIDANQVREMKDQHTSAIHLENNYVNAHTSAIMNDKIDKQTEAADLRQLKDEEITANYHPDYAEIQTSPTKFDNGMKVDVSIGTKQTPEKITKDKQFSDSEVITDFDIDAMNIVSNIEKKDTTKDTIENRGNGKDDNNNTGNNKMRCENKDNRSKYKNNENDDIDNENKYVSDEKNEKRSRKGQNDDTDNHESSKKGKKSNYSKEDREADEKRIRDLKKENALLAQKVKEIKQSRSQLNQSQQKQSTENIKKNDKTSNYSTHESTSSNKNTCSSSYSYKTTNSDKYDAAEKKKNHKSKNEKKNINKAEKSSEKYTEEDETSSNENKLNTPKNMDNGMNFTTPQIKRSDDNEQNQINTPDQNHQRINVDAPLQNQNNQQIPNPNLLYGQNQDNNAYNIQNPTQNQNVQYQNPQGSANYPQNYQFAQDRQNQVPNGQFYSSNQQQFPYNPYIYGYNQDNMQNVQPLNQGMQRMSLQSANPNQSPMHRSQEQFQTTIPNPNIPNYPQQQIFASQDFLLQPQPMQRNVYQNIQNPSFPYQQQGFNQQIPLRQTHGNMPYQEFNQQMPQPNYQQVNQQGMNYPQTGQQIPHAFSNPNLQQCFDQAPQNIQNPNIPFQMQQQNGIQSGGFYIHPQNIPQFNAPQQPYQNINMAPQPTNLVPNQQIPQNAQQFGFMVPNNTQNAQKYPLRPQQNIQNPSQPQQFNAQQNQIPQKFVQKDNQQVVNQNQQQNPNQKPKVQISHQVNKPEKSNQIASQKHGDNKQKSKGEEKSKHEKHRKHRRSSLVTQSEKENDTKASNDSNEKESLENKETHHHKHKRSKSTEKGKENIQTKANERINKDEKKRRKLEKENDKDKEKEKEIKEENKHSHHHHHHHDHKLVSPEIKKEENGEKSSSHRSHSSKRSKERDGNYKRTSEVRRSLPVSVEKEIQKAGTIDKLIRKYRYENGELMAEIEMKAIKTGEHRSKPETKYHEKDEKMEVMVQKDGNLYQRVVALEKITKNQQQKINKIDGILKKEISDYSENSPQPSPISFKFPTKDEKVRKWISSQISDRKIKKLSLIGDEELQKNEEYVIFIPQKGLGAQIPPSPIVYKELNGRIPKHFVVCAAYLGKIGEGGKRTKEPTLSTLAKMQSKGFDTLKYTQDDIESYFIASNRKIRIICLIDM